MKNTSLIMMIYCVWNEFVKNAMPFHIHTRNELNSKHRMNGISVKNLFAHSQHIQRRCLLAEERENKRDWNTNFLIQDTNLCVWTEPARQFFNDFIRLA